MYKSHLRGLGLFLYLVLVLGLVAILLHFSTLGEVGGTFTRVTSPPAALPEKLESVFANSESIPLQEHPAERGLSVESSDGLTLFDTSASLYDYADRLEHLKRLESLSSFHATALAPLTAKAQRFLYEWQHPSSCTDQNFIVSEGNPEGGGLGSNLFVATHHFAMALDKGAIFLWRWNAADDFIDTVHCAKTPGIECFVEAPSNCTLHDAFDVGSGFKPGTIEVRMGNAGQTLGFPDFHYVPKIFQQMWAEAGLPVEEGTPAGGKDPRAYWYKTQVVAYLARFNRVTVEALRAQRANTSNYMAASGPAVPVAHRASMLTLPLPAGTMCAHIRHGDKEMEMRLIPTNLYMDAALKIADMQPLMTPTRNVFVTSEDPGALDFLNNSLAKVPEYNHWSMAWFSAMPRRDSNGRDQLNAFVDIIPKAKLTRLWFLQLTLALECDSWIGTRGSNWNKLIDVLRCVWVPKCQNYMVDVGDNIWR